jgi:hypothetical protein
VRWEDAEVAEDAGVAQARMLVGLLRDEIAEISDKLTPESCSNSAARSNGSAPPIVGNVKPLTPVR